MVEIMNKNLVLGFWIAALTLASSNLIAGGDLEMNTVDITVFGDTTVKTPLSGEGNLGWGIFKGGSIDIGGSTVVNGVEISCALLASNCGNLNEFDIDVTGTTVVEGTDAVVNGARFTSGNAFFK
jgi:hypothetical protein